MSLLKTFGVSLLVKCGAWQTPEHMKATLIVLALFTVFLGYRVLGLEQEVKQLQMNAAIAVLSAEAANNKVGAIAPFFSQDKGAFTKAWLDSVNMPLAVFPEDVLVPLKRTLEEKRMSKESQQLKATVFK
jgi:hypothetical protein